MDISDMRREYESMGLSREELDGDPFRQFEQWFAQARESGIEEANALTLAAADASGAPSARTVLLKYFDGNGFVFFTNYASRKARALEANPCAAMLFPWIALNRQVAVEGAVEKVSRAESIRYFMSRPEGSQLGAWVSDQSAVIESREALEAKLERIKARFQQGSIPVPEFWGGYRVIPQRLEFWQGRPNRLHDRFEYQWDGETWRINRLQP